MSPEDPWIIGYMVIALIVAAITWIENRRVYYTRGEPSGCLTGILWPAVATLIVGFWTYRLFKLVRRLAAPTTPIKAEDHE